MILTLSLTPKFATPGCASLYALLGGPTYFKPTLVDPVNLRVYGVVEGGGKGLSSAHTTATTYSGAPMFLWAAFAAPPTDVENLNIFDTLPTIMDVPVQ